MVWGGLVCFGVFPRLAITQNKFHFQHTCKFQNFNLTMNCLQIVLRNSNLVMKYHKIVFEKLNLSVDCLKIFYPILILSVGESS